MTTNRNWIGWLILIPLLSACSSGGDSAAVAEEYQAMRKAAEKAATEEEKYQLWFDFLAKYPDTPYAVPAIRFLTTAYYIEARKDPEAAIRFAEEQLTKLTDSKEITRARKMLISVYGEARRPDRIAAIARELGDELVLYDYLSVAEAASKAEDWELAAKYAGQALELATPEKIREEAGEEELEGDEIARRLEAIRGYALGSLGVAQSKLGQSDAALASFQEASGFLKPNAAGISWADFRETWAETLLAKGDANGAMEVISGDAMLQGTDSALKIYQQAYLAGGGHEADFPAHVSAVRERMAKPLPSFAAYTYDGKKVTSEELKGKVTLVTFWFPT